MNCWSRLGLKVGFIDMFARERADIGAIRMCVTNKERSKVVGYSGYSTQTGPLSDGSLANVGGYCGGSGDAFPTEPVVQREPHLIKSQ